MDKWTFHTTAVAMNREESKNKRVFMGIFEHSVFQKKVHQTGLL